MPKLLAVDGGRKIVVSSEMSHQKCQELRRQLITSHDHFDMLGKTTCTYRIKSK